MSKKTKKVTARTQRLSQYNNIISKNRSKFKAGFIFSRQEFIDTFGITGIPKKGNYSTLHRGNLKLLSVQQEINDLLRESGMYLKSSNYYSEFAILKKEPTKAKIAHYSASVDRKEAQADRLTDGMEARGAAWGTFVKVPDSTIPTLGEVEQSRRHENYMVRIDTI